MQKFFTSARIGIVAVALTAFSVPMLTPTPAAAWWYHGRAVWHAGYGWHPGWQGCCRGPGVVVGVVPPVVVVRRPIVYAPRPVVAGPVWIRPHWNGPYWVGGHWG